MECDTCNRRVECLLINIEPSFCQALHEALFKCMNKWAELGLDTDVIDLMIRTSYIQDNDYEVSDTVAIEMLRSAGGAYVFESKSHRHESEVPGEKSFDITDW
jgi:hypothetical protein